MGNGSSKKVLLRRGPSEPEGTFGELFWVIRDDYGNPILKHLAVTVERCWLNNRPFVSCIPPGTFRCVQRLHWHLSDVLVEGIRLGWCWELKGVPARSNILIHPANWARQLEGCIAPGFEMTEILGAKGVSFSTPIFRLLKSMLGPEFELTIEEAPRS